MNRNSQNESAEIKVAFADVIELLELTKYLPNSSSIIMAKQIRRASRSTCANLVEMIVLEKGRRED